MSIKMINSQKAILATTVGIAIASYPSLTMADAALKVKNSGVPSFDFSKLKKSKDGLPPRVPVVNLAPEPSVSAQSFSEVVTPTSPSSIAPVGAVQPLKRSRIESPLKKGLHSAPLSAAQLSKMEKNLANPSALPSIDKELEVISQISPKPTNDVEALAVKQLTPAEIELVKSLIYLDIRKDSLMSLVLLATLKDSASEPKDSILFHYARAAWSAGLPSESRLNMGLLLKSKNNILKMESVKFMIETARKGEADLIESIEQARGEKEFEYSPQYLINLGIYWDRKGDISKSLEALERVPDESDVAPEAIFLKSIIAYRTGEVKKAEQGLNDVLNRIEKARENNSLRSISALTLARIQFQTGEYEKAHQTYLKVHKAHSEWHQAMMEQAWAQILNKDYEGAAGNMFTLHTDFFKNTFAPESYVVRTVGYLNLCQFGDGMKALTDLKNRYTRLNEFINQKKLSRDKNLELYSAVKAMIQNPNKKDGWEYPKQVLIELARSPRFAKAQEKINAIEDESQRFAQVILDVLQRERQLTQNISQLVDQMAKASGKSFSEESVAKMQEDLERARWELQLVKKSRKALRASQSKALESASKLKDSYKAQAESSLQARYAEVKKTLSHVLDQSEILRYELFAGASHHLRNENSPETVAEKRAANDKNPDRMKWEFRGEIWEDELGHFRSSLKNVCTENENNKQTVGSNE